MRAVATSCAVAALLLVAPGLTRAQEEAVPLAWDAWGHGTWQDGGLHTTVTPDLLTLAYEVGAEPDQWPNAQIVFPQPYDAGHSSRFVFELRVTTNPKVDSLPPRFFSILLGSAFGAGWQQDMLPVHAVPGEWVTESISLLRVPAGFVQALGKFQFFTWNRDYHEAGMPAGTQVTFEVRNPRLAGVRPESGPSIFSRPPLQRLLGESDGLKAWSEPADTKLLPEQAPPSVPAGPVELTAAGNEYADFQVALRASHALAPVSVAVSSPQPAGGGLAPAGFTTQVRLEGLIRTEKPSGCLMRPGLCPDPLLYETAVTLEPDQTRGMWVNLYVPDQAPPGDYEGTVTLSAGGQTLIQAPYRLHVYDYSLPRTPALRTAFQLSVDEGWSHMMVHYPGADYEMIRKLWQSMADHRIAPMHLGPGGAPRPADPAALASFDRYVDLAKDLGFNSFGPFMWGPPVEKEEDRVWVRQMMDHYAEKGVLDNLYVYMCQFDEANPTRYLALREYATALKAADPRAQRFITVAPHPDLYGAIDWWCPGTPSYNKEIARQRRAQGERVWWYTCVTWTPGLLLDAPGAEHRALLWLTLTQEADGLLFWCIDFWPNNPWETPVMGPGTAGNGDGYLLYPRRDGDPPDRFYETVRLEVLRESLEDYDHLAILKARLTAAEAAGTAPPEALAAAREALADADKIATDATTYSLDPADYAYVRGLVASAIEGLPPAR
jgi:hypothetical protein